MVKQSVINSVFSKPCCAEAKNCSSMAIKKLRIEISARMVRVVIFEK